MPTTSWKSPGTVTSETRSGGAISWNDPFEAGESNDVYTSAAITATDASHWLWAVDFGFTTSDIPSGATIVGIEVDVERFITLGDLTEPTFGSTEYFKLIKGGAETGTLKTTATQPPGTDEIKSAGGASDMWGATISDSDARSSTTGWAYAYANDGYLTSTLSVDHMRMRYHYTAFANKYSSAFLVFHQIVCGLVRFFTRKNRTRILIPVNQAQS